MAFRSRMLSVVLVIAAAAAVGACGSEGVEIASDESQDVRRGAELFNERCAGCHTLKAAGTQGSAQKANDTEYKDGPNFDVRKESYDAAIYAIRNGGFSSGPMPQNIVVGQDAEDVARFLEKYSGGSSP
jgi:mono/diheme cytochrome c family protein